MKIALLLALAPAIFAAAPTVSKVEPPDWPAEPAGASLRVLVTGTNLAGAGVRCDFPTSRTGVSASGTHLFLDLTVPPKASPGPHPIEISTAEGKVQAPFSLFAPLPSQGRFQGFTGDDLIYLIMTDRFVNGDPSNDDPSLSKGLFDPKRDRFYHGGDFAGIVRELPYLKNLGVTAIWLTPIYDNVNHPNERETYGHGPITDYHGYGAVDFYGVEEHFGTLAEFRDLVERAHALGIKVIQDQVANHTGPYHPWVKDSPTPTWFNGTAAKHIDESWRTWTLIDPHAPAALSRSTLDGWFGGFLPDLNQNDPEVARYLIQNSLWWIARTGIDGIRQDTLPYAPRAFWREWSGAIHKRYPQFRMVGEVYDSDPALVAFFQGGAARFDGVDSGIDSVFDFPLNAVVRKVFTGAAPALELPKLLAHDYLYPDASRLVTFAANHDMARFMNLPGAAAGGLERALAFLLTARGIPALYYGDEIGMPGGEDPDNRRDFPGAANFTPAQQEIAGSVRKVAAARAASEALRRGKMIHLFADEKVFAFARVTDRDRALVVVNNGAAATLSIPVEGAGLRDGPLEDKLGEAGTASIKNGVAEVHMPAQKVAIYR